MRYAGPLTAFAMATFVASSLSFRPIVLRTSRNVYATRLEASERCRRGCFRGRTQRGRGQIRPSMLLGVDTGLGIVGISALSALRLFSANMAPKRVRVVTDIDDTVKSSGNKRLLGIPLGGIDAQCKSHHYHGPVAHAFRL